MNSAGIGRRPDHLRTSKGGATMMPVEIRRSTAISWRRRPPSCGISRAPCGDFRDGDW